MQNQLKAFESCKGERYSAATSLECTQYIQHSSHDLSFYSPRGGQDVFAEDDKSLVGSIHSPPVAHKRQHAALKPLIAVWQLMRLDYWYHWRPDTQ